MFQAATLYIEQMNISFMQSADVVALCSAVVCCEEPNYTEECKSNKKLQTLFQYSSKDGGLCYYKYGFGCALSKVLEETDGTDDRKWLVKDPYKPEHPSDTIVTSKNEKQQANDRTGLDIHV